MSEYQENGEWDLLRHQYRKPTVYLGEQTKPFLLRQVMLDSTCQESLSENEQIDNWLHFTQIWCDLTLYVSVLVELKGGTMRWRVVEENDY